MVFKDGTGPFLRTHKEGGGLQRGLWSSKGAVVQKREVVLLQGHSKKGVVLKGSSGPKEGSGPLTRSFKEGCGPQREQWSSKGSGPLTRSFKEGSGPQREQWSKRGKWSSYKVIQRREWSSKGAVVQKREVVLLQGHSKKGVVLKGSSGPKEGSGPLTRSFKEGSGPQGEQWSKRGKWSSYKVIQRREWSSRGAVVQKREVVLLQGHSKKGVVLKGSSGPKEGSGPLTRSLKEGSGLQRC